jgi:ADP-ribosylglycohydrolase
MPAMTTPEAARWNDAVAGAVMAAAIGDAMGHPTEFLDMKTIRAKYGSDGVEGFELLWTRDGREFAPYTDDTQMAEIVSRVLLQARREELSLDAAMKLMATGFIEWNDHPQGGHRAPGAACVAGCEALKAGTPWDKAGGAAAGGCGSVMRAFPFGIVFSDNADQAEAWAVAHSKLTHRDPIALAACAAMARGMCAVLQRATPEEVIGEMQDAARKHSAITATMIGRAADEAYAGTGPEVTLERLRGWAAHEAVAAAAYLFARNPDDPRTAILEGANTPGDSDSIATLAGALLGARCGLAELPEEWVQDVERSEELLALAAELSAL